MQKVFLKIEKMILDKFTFTYRVNKDYVLNINYGPGSCKVLLEHNEDTAMFLNILRKHKNGTGSISRDVWYLTRCMEITPKKVKTPMYKLRIGVVTEPDLTFYGETIINKNSAPDTIYYRNQYYCRVNTKENCYILESSYNRLFQQTA